VRVSSDWSLGGGRRSRERERSTSVVRGERLWSERVSTTGRFDRTLRIRSIFTLTELGEVGEVPQLLSVTSGILNSRMLLEKS